MDNIIYILIIFITIFIWLNNSKKDTKNYYINMFNKVKIYIALGLIINFLLFCNKSNLNKLIMERSIIDI